MELSRQNLVSLTINENVLSQNFKAIQDWINALRRQIGTLQVQNAEFKEKIAIIDDRVNGTDNKIEEQRENFRKSQLAFANKLRTSQSQQRRAFQEDEIQFQKEFGYQKEIQHNLQMEQLSLNKQPVQSSENIKANENNAKLLRTSDSVLTQKNGLRKQLQKVIAQLRGRIVSLEEQSVRKEAMFQTFDNDLADIKTNGANGNGKFRIINKQSSAEKKLAKEQFSRKNITKKTQVFESFSDLPSKTKSDASQKAEQGAKCQLQLQIDLKNQDQDQLGKQLQKLKQFVIIKTKSLEANLVQNQKKLHNVERNIDMLERSQDVLKFDIQKTTHSWGFQNPKSRSLMSANEGASRHQQILNDTRVTNQQYYEDKLVEMFNEMEFIKAQYLDMLGRIENQDQQGDKEKSKEERSKRIGAKIKESKADDQKVKKELINCKKDLRKLREQFNELILGVNNGTNQIKTYIIKPNETKQDWKSLSIKIYKAKQQMQSGIKQLEGKIVTNNDVNVLLNQLEVGIEECRLLSKRKVQIVDFQKVIKRIDNRLSNFIAQVFERDGCMSENDAMVAKQPWFCLSCDGQLKNYSGKIAKPMANQKLNGKKVNIESHMVRRNENGRLPSVAK